MDPHPGFDAATTALIERLYHTKIHISRKDRKEALAIEYAPPQLPSLEYMRKTNKGAVIQKFETAHPHGLTIVNYHGEKGVKEKKENAMIHRGKSRNNYGGFFSS